jgi:L-asparaginase
MSPHLELHPIKIFVTGGTFDKEYNELTGQLYFRETHLPEMLKFGRSQLDVSVETLMMIDSLEITEEMREDIAKKVSEAKEERIVITHGTDTMVKTAQLIAERVPNKTVVLAGAMIPYQFGGSDGLFNLGSALAFVQVLPHGSYVVMNGRCFNHDNVYKNKETGRFEKITE